MKNAIKYKNVENKRTISSDKNYCKEIINKFYSSLKFNKFKNISKERMAEIDNIATYWSERLRYNDNDTPTVMTIIVNQLFASRQKFNLVNDDEVLYFYIKVVDSKFKFLELSQIAKDKKELVILLIRYFGIYDNVIIYLEENLDRRLQELEQNESKER